MNILFIWLMLFTKLDNNSKTTNKEIKQRFLKDNPKYKNIKRLQLLIGLYLKDIYPDITTGGGLPKCYNIKLLPAPKDDLKMCTLNELLEGVLYEL